MSLEPSYDVPEGETAAAQCPYCGRPFATERLGTFHVGRRHAEAMDETEREAFETATDDERYDVFSYHLKAAVSVFLVYFLFTMIYGLVWSN